MEAITDLEWIVIQTTNLGSIGCTLAYGANLLCLLTAMISIKISSALGPNVDELQTEYYMKIIETGASFIAVGFFIDRMSRILGVMVRTKPTRWLSRAAFWSWLILLVVVRNNEFFERWVILELHSNLVTSMHWLYCVLPAWLRTWFGGPRIQNATQ